MINGEARYCLWLKDAEPSRLRRSRFIKDRIEKVKAYRLASKREATRTLADTPALFGEIRHTGRPYVLVPRQLFGAP